MRKSTSREELLTSITELARRGNLGAVIVHMNDTYLIEERADAGIPGMPRIAGLINAIRECVMREVAEDRTLVVHSGDYLSPSAMSLQFKGSQMLDLLTCCSVSYATLGNHEFDFGADVLSQRLAEAGFATLVANALPPARMTLSIDKLAFWPKQQPFVAITGLVGDETLADAKRCGFEALELESTVNSVLKEVAARPEVGALVVLSHMKREEDMALQKVLNSRWHRNGFVYLLGGHDHDISFPQLNRKNCLLSKCFSNCKSVTIFLLSADGLAAPASVWSIPTDPSPSMEQEMKILEEVSTSRTLDDNPIRISDTKTARDAVLDPTRVRTLGDVLRVYRQTCQQNSRPDFRKAFEATVEEAYGFYRNSVPELVLNGTLGRDVLETAIAYARDGFRQGCIEIRDWDHLQQWPLDPKAVERLQVWQSREGTQRADEVVADLRSQLPVGSTMLDAQEKTLRWHSTDFGNFIADAIQAATDADAVLLNSGSFRLDGFVPARFTMQHLRDVFLFDCDEKTVVLLELKPSELEQLLEHGMRNPGSGAFPQVSFPLPKMPRVSGRLLKVALVRHMVANAADGFQGVLSKLRGTSAGEFTRSLPALTIGHGRLRELVRQGARRNISYSAARRIDQRVTLPPTARAAADLMELVDRYIRACEPAGLHYEARLDLLEEGIEPEAFEAYPDIRQSVEELHSFISSLSARRPADVTYKGFYEYLLHSREVSENNVLYQDYLASLW